MEGKNRQEGRGRKMRSVFEEIYSGKKFTGNSVPVRGRERENARARAGGGGGVPRDAVGRSAQTFRRISRNGRRRAGRGVQVWLSRRRQDRHPHGRRSGGRPLGGIAAGHERAGEKLVSPPHIHFCDIFTHSPVSASWNIIQYPFPERSNTERGRKEQYPFRASGGSPRLSAGTP